MATGGEGPLTFTLAAEYIPSRLRGYVILVLGFGGSVGGYAYIFDWYWV